MFDLALEDSKVGRGFDGVAIDGLVLAPDAVGAEDGVTHCAVPVSDACGELIKEAAGSGSAYAPCAFDTAHGSRIVRDGVLGEDAAVSEEGSPAVSAGELGSVIHTHDVDFAKDKAQGCAE